MNEQERNEEAYEILKDLVEMQYQKSFSGGLSEWQKREYKAWQRAREFFEP